MIPQITVVIASYRYGHLAAQAVDSVLSQTVAPSRVMFVDDGVGDCRHIAKIYPEVEFIARKRNLGVVANFNDMLQRVETPRVLFLGADNWLRQDALQLLSAELAAAPGTDIISYDIAVTGTQSRAFAAAVGARATHQGYPVWRFDPRGDVNVGNFIHGSSLYNANLAKRYGYASSGNGHTEEDWVLFRRMLNAGATHRHVPVPLLYYRRHRENSNQP